MEEDKEKLFIEDNYFFRHIFRYQKIYLSILLIIVLTFPLLGKLSAGSPLLSGEESYYHLTKAEQVGLSNIIYLPLYLLNKILPLQAMALLPLFLSLISLWLMFRLAEIKKIPERELFFFLLLVILSPAFVHNFSVISTYAIFTTFVLLAFFLLEKKETYNHIISMIILLALSGFDLFSTLLLIIILLIYGFYNRDKKIVWLIILSLFITMIMQGLLAGEHFLIEQFETKNIIGDIISDLGGRSGVSFFTFVMAVIGAMIIWQRKKFAWSYLFLSLLLPAYVYNTNLSFLLSLVFTISATIAFMKIFERRWVLKSLKNFTMLIFILGIVFSMVSFENRINQDSLTTEEFKVLSWMDERIFDQLIVFTAESERYYVNHLGGKKTIYDFYEDEGYNKELEKNIMEAEYIDELFPLLEQNNVSIIYIPAEMKKYLPEDQGLLFLLRNERFKLAQGQEGTELWLFDKNAE